MTGPDMHRARRGYSLVELLVVVGIIAVMAMVAVPRFSYGIVSKTKAKAAAYRLVTDLRRTRSLAIQDAATNKKGYSLSMTGSAPYTGYQIENEDTKQTVDSCQFTSGVTATIQGPNKFTFEPLGNLKPGSGSQITVIAGDGRYTISFVASTGAVICTGG